MREAQHTQTLADKSIEEATYNPQYGYSAHKKSAKMKDLGHYSSSDQSQKLFRALEYQYNHQQN